MSRGWDDDHRLRRQLGHDGRFFNRARSAPDPQTLTKAFKERSYSPYVNHNFPSQLLWGDTHLHTAISFDAGAFGNRLCPPVQAVLVRYTSICVGAERWAKPAVLAQLKGTMESLFARGGRRGRRHRISLLLIAIEPIEGS